MCYLTGKTEGMLVWSPTTSSRFSVLQYGSILSQKNSPDVIVTLHVSFDDATIQPACLNFCVKRELIHDVGQWNPEQEAN